MTNEEFITAASNLWMDLLKRKTNLSKLDLESAEELIKSVIKSTIEFKDEQMKSLCEKTQWIFDKTPDDCRIVLAAIFLDEEPQLYVGYYLQSKQAWYLNDYGYRDEVYCWMDIPEVQPLKAMEE